ncbi:MAG: acyl-CoA synthetase FdrA [Rubrivivax sp.]|nr:acyl-CoA synthetase FdrA [Rubrivivax sp.]
MPAPLHTLAYIVANQYKDSVALMRVAQRLLALPEVVNATLQLGNAANKEILQEAGLLGPEVRSAGPSDIMVVVQARTGAACEAARALAGEQLSGRDEAVGSPAPGAARGPAATTLAMAQARFAQAAGAGAAGAAQANIAQISVPGAYAAAEALKAVKLGLHVFMFSDNVPLEQEVVLKREARRRGLLVMGPDCGTALIGGVPLGFANNVRRGPIGLVAASGTGLQEVSTQIHRMGGGISHAIGTGGRDIRAEVGGITMLQAIHLLARDEGTRVIAVLCKPPAPAVAVQVRSALRAAGKPAVVLFIGAQVAGGQGRAAAEPPGGAPQRTVHTLVDCAAAAVRLSGRRNQEGVARDSYAMARRPRFAPSQKYLRALYSGGTFAAEAQALWARAGLRVWSNVPLDDALALPDPKRASVEHAALDLGDDQFTLGRPHPMIDQAARIERLLAEAADPTTRVILLDVVIGHGAHADPAGELAPALREARRIAARDGRTLGLVGFVCGTELDPQGLAQQEATLRGAGMALAGNSANAAWLAQQWVLA